MKAVKKAVDVGIVARDPDTMLAWYRDVLGLEFVETFTVVIGRIHRLRFGDSYFKIAEAKRNRQAPVGERTFDDPGAYCTFETDDVQPVWDRLMKAGAPVVLPLNKLAGNLAAGAVRDPEGNVVEVITRTPA